MQEKLDINVVTTLYKSSSYIEEFTERMEKTLKSVDLTYKIIFVNDGSPDNSVDIIKRLQKTNKKLALVNFSRNFGHHQAIFCGLERTNAKYVFLIDIDLEEDSELFVDFYNKIKKTKEDLIYGVQNVRNKDKFFGNLYWKVLTSLTNLKLEKNSCTISIMNEKFISKIKEFKQKNLLFIEIFSHIGLKQSTILVDKKYKGKSTYSFMKKYDFFFDVIFTNTRDFWLKLSFASILCSFLLFLLSGTLLTMYLLGYRFLTGWLSTILIISLFFSVSFLFFAIILQVLSKILHEVKEKPRVIIDEEIGL